MKTEKAKSQNEGYMPITPAPAKILLVYKNDKTKQSTMTICFKMTYCEVLVGGEKLIIAEEALERILQDEKYQPLDYEVLRTFPGSELVGKKYQPLNTGSTWPENDKIHTIYAADGAFRAPAAAP